MLQDFRYAVRSSEQPPRHHPGHRRVARDRHRRQHRDLQRRQRAAPEAAAVSGTRSARRAVAAFAGHQHSSGLAVARAIHRHPATRTTRSRQMSISRGRSRHADRPRSAGAGRSSCARRPTCSTSSARTPLHGRLLPARRRRPGKDARRRAESRLLEADVRRRPWHRRPQHHAERHRRVARAKNNNQFIVAGVLPARRPEMNDEVMQTVASIGQHRHRSCRCRSAPMR